MNKDGCAKPQLVVQIDCGEEAAQLWAQRMEGQGTGVVLAVDSSGASRQAPSSGTAGAGVQPANETYLLRVFQAQPAAVRNFMEELPVFADVLHICTPPFESTREQPGLKNYLRFAGEWLDVLAPGGILMMPTDNATIVALTMTELGLNAWSAEAVPEQAGPGHLLLKFPGAEPWPQGWVPTNVSTSAVFVNFSTSIKTVICGFSWTSGRDGGQWGNLIGPYFQCLSLAQLLGWSFYYVSNFKGHWMERLPQHVEPGLARFSPAEVKRAIDVCDPEFWTYPHDCLYGWRAAKPAIQFIMRRAFFSWLADEGKQLQRFGPTDALLQVRCAKDTLLWHYSYGPTAYSYYLRNIPAETKQVYALFARHGFLSPKHYEPCERVVEGLGRYITKRRPELQFKVIGGELWEDFGRLITAPTVFVEGSSLGLWAALANKGRVIHPPFLAPIRTDRWHSAAYLKPRVHPRFVVADANVLYPEVALAHDVTIEDVDGIVRWLETF